MSLLSQSCAEAARLISDSHEHSLPWMARAGLGMHLAICRHCRRYRQQLQLLRAVFHEYPHRLQSVRLPDDFRKQLLRQLRNEAP